jgi:hypothetical protein
MRLLHTPLYQHQLQQLCLLLQVWEKITRRLRVTCPSINAAQHF